MVLTLALALARAQGLPLEVVMLMYGIEPESVSSISGSTRPEARLDPLALPALSAPPGELHQ